MRVWQDVYANFCVFLFELAVKWRKRKWRKRSKFITHKFIRVSRKKEINFHKFESQIKLREKKKHSRGRVFLKPYTCHAMPPRLSSYGFCFCFLRFACFRRNGKLRNSLRWKLNSIFKFYTLWVRVCGEKFMKILFIILRICNLHLVFPFTIYNQTSSSFFTAMVSFSKTNFPRTREQWSLNINTRNAF